MAFHLLNQVNYQDEGPTCEHVSQVGFFVNIFICITLSLLITGCGGNNSTNSTSSMLLPPILVSPVSNHNLTDLSAVKLEWRSVNDATTYELQIAAEISFNSTIIKQTNLTSTSYTTNLSQQTESIFYWRVRGKNNNLNGVWSDIFSFSKQDTSTRWRLVWGDEFSSENIDNTRWEYEVNCWGGGNQELQCYTSNSANSFIENGMLHIRAQKETVTGLNGPDGISGETVTRDYSSARLRTKSNGDWKYGRFEIRAQLPYGQGTWPAIWMLATNSPYGGWAASGEIDILEAVNLRTGGEDDNVVIGTLHYGGEWPNNVLSSRRHTLSNDPSTQFHVYALEWEEDEIRWYVDDTHYATAVSSRWYSSVNGEIPNERAPFDQEFHLLLNLAIGGNLPDNIIDDDIFPIDMVIDYVRVYECSVNPNTGVGCGSKNPDIIPNTGHTPPVDGLTVQLPYNILSNGVTSILEHVGFNPTWEIVVENGVTQQSEITVTKTVDSGDNQNSARKIKFLNENVSVQYYFKTNDDETVNLENANSISFDIQLISQASSPLIFRVDSGYPNRVEIDITSQLTLNQWKTITITKSDLTSNTIDNFNIKRVTTPFLLFTEGAYELDLANIRWNN